MRCWRRCYRTSLEVDPSGRSFNLIHFASSYKFDIFPLLPDAFHQSQFSRRLDRGYLRHWAAYLEVADLADAAFGAAG